MKHFKIIGPETTRDFDIEDDEMIQWKVFKINDYVYNPSNLKEYDLHNDVISKTNEGTSQ